MLKCLLIAVTIVPLYLLFLVAGAIVWFMEQLRYFLAVSGTMMLPLFTGMFSLPEGHFNRQAAQNYVMHMLSLALWPVAWAIGHTGTIALYNALVSLIAGTSRVPDLVGVLQWSSVTGSVPSAVQVQATETALGNWFMGNLTALLSILVGGLGFVLWVVIVSILGPAFLHKLLTTGALFMSQAAGTTGRQAAVAGKLAFSAGAGRGTGRSPRDPGDGGRVPASGCPGRRRHWRRPSREASAQRWAPAARRGASMRDAARSVDISGGKNACSHVTVRACLFPASSDPRPPAPRGFSTASFASWARSFSPSSPSSCSSTSSASKGTSTRPGWPWTVSRTPPRSRA